MAVMPMKRLMTMRNTYAELGTSNQKEAGYMMGVMDHLWANSSSHRVPPATSMPAPHPSPAYP